MALTYPLALHTTPGIRKITWKGSGNTAYTRSEFTKQMQFFRFRGDLLRAEVELPLMTREQYSAWMAWGLSLRGRWGTFLIGPVEKVPRGTGAGSPLVDGSGQTGDTLLTKGWGVSQTVLKAGDWFHLWEDKAVLHMALTDVVSNGSGIATVELFPNIRVAPANDAAIQVNTPQGTFRLDDDTFSWMTEPKYLTSIKFNIVEAC